MKGTAYNAEEHGRYTVQERGPWRICLCDNSRMTDNLATKGRGEKTVYRPAVVAAHIESTELAQRIADALNALEGDSE